MLKNACTNNGLSICKENNIPVYEKNFSLDDVYSADEVFVTGTFAGIIPAIEIDGHSINQGIRGSQTLSLQNLYKRHLDA